MNGEESVRRTFQAAGACLLACGAAFAAYLAWLPDVSSLALSNPMTTKYVQLYVRRMRARGGNPAVSMKWTPLARMSPHLVNAVLLAEDDLFYRHRGVDWRSMRLAVDYNIRVGRMARGASTITQQVARNLFLSPSRRPQRKLEEVLLARYLERSLEKDRILEIYLNIVEWGEGIFGAEAASQAYFKKASADLSPEEAVALAAALPSPYRLNPLREPTPLLLRKRELLLERMRRWGRLPEEESP